MNGNIHIERLTQADERTCEELNRLLPQLSSDQIQLTLERLKAMTADPNIHLKVLKDGDRIIGMATLALAPLPLRLRSYVEDVVVDEAYRGQGLGRRLMEDLIETAKKAGAMEAMLTSRSSRVAANALYQSLGFQKKETNVYRMKF